jgi:hypothetical protein
MGHILVTHWYLGELIVAQDVKPGDRAAPADDCSRVRQCVQAREMILVAGEAARASRSFSVGRALARGYPVLLGCSGSGCVWYCSGNVW